jgi:hypothetical protein
MRAMRRLLLIACLAVSMSMAIPCAAQKSEPSAVLATAEKALQVESAIADLQIIETRLHDFGSGMLMAYFRVRNKSEKAILYITMGSGGEKPSVTHTVGQKGAILVAAGEIYELRFPVRDVPAGMPIRIGGVAYADGSIEGDEEPIKTLRYQIERARLAAVTEPESEPKLPQVESAVADLPIIETSIVEPGSRFASVLIKVRNNSGKEITHITVSSSDKTDSMGITSGTTKGVLVPAGEEYELRFPLSNIVRGRPIRIGGVVYADGSIVGDEKGIKILRDQLEHDRISATGRVTIIQ